MMKHAAPAFRSRFGTVTDIIALFLPRTSTPGIVRIAEVAADPWIGEDQWLAGLPSNRNERFDWWPFPGQK
jgi:hypothetical protein